MVFSDGKYMDYVYSATGEKRSVTYNVLSSDGSYTYCDNFIYYNGDLNKILVDGGYISISGTTPTYHYYLKDHLGNNRVVVDASGTVKQVTHYYPFGGFFGESTGSSYQAYKYNGKEFERLISEDWYDYGARHMDGMRFTTMDPMAEKYYSISPYAYCTNNPINYIDPDGNRVQIYKKNQKQVLGYINKLAQGTFAIDKKGYLFLAKSSNSKGFSKTYTESLVRAINNKDKTIIVYVDDHYYDDKGNKQDISKKGEGTTKEFYNGMIVVVISGKSYKGLVGKDGISISDEPEYILAHEIAGHAEPRLNNTGNGEVVNAVEIENKIRRETYKKERKEEPSHVQ